MDQPEGKNIRWCNHKHALLPPQTLFSSLKPSPLAPLPHWRGPQNPLKAREVVELAWSHPLAILISSVWRGAWEFSFLTSSQVVMLLLLLQGSPLETHLPTETLFCQWEVQPWQWFSTKVIPHPPALRRQNPEGFLVVITNWGAGGGVGVALLDI